MVTICSRKFCKPTIQDIMLSKIRKKQENEDIEEFFRKLKEKRERVVGSARVLSGTLVPNSTFRSLHSNGKIEQEKDNSVLSIKTNNERNDEIKSSISITSKHTLPSALGGSKYTDEGKDNVLPEEKSRASSLLSSTSTLEELKELRDLLNKSSYVPKKIKARRPTIEKIKSAIEREKQFLNDKNESIMSNSNELTDESTSTEEIIRKKKTKGAKKPSSSLGIMAKKISKTIDSGSNSVQGGKKRLRKKRKKKKIESKIDVGIQCSVFEIKKDDENVLKNS